jgi:hypothetical protein
MFRPYVQDTSDWIKYYETGSKSNKDSGESTGGIGADSGGVANPVEKSVPNNLDVIKNKMRTGELSSQPSDQSVVQAIAQTKRRRKRRKICRRKRKKNGKKVKKKVRKVIKKKKNGKKRRKKKKKKPRDLFDP